MSGCSCLSGRRWPCRSAGSRVTVAQAREIVRQAKEQAAAEKDSGGSVEERRAEFLKLYEKIIDQIPVSNC